MVLDFRDAAFSAVFNIMAVDKDIIVLYNDFGAQGLDLIKTEFPNRAINVGIAEQNLISVAAGLALTGKKIVIYSIAAHITTRCYEQLKLDICGMKLPVIILGMGSGLSYGVDGPTHQAVEDIGIVRSLPGITIYNPADAICTQAIVHLAYELGTPVYIRLDKDQHTAIYKNGGCEFSEGFTFFDNHGSITVITTGMMVHRAILVSKTLLDEGIKINVVDLYRIKPCNEVLLRRIITDSTHIVTLEEHSSIGGIGSIIAEIIASLDKKIPYSKFSLPDEISLGSTSRSWAHEKNNISFEKFLFSLKKIHSNILANNRQQNI